MTSRRKTRTASETAEIDIFNSGERRKDNSYGCNPMTDYLPVQTNEHGELHVIACVCGAAFVVRASDRMGLSLYTLKSRDEMMYERVRNAIVEAFDNGLWKGTSFSIQRYRRQT